MQLRLYFDFPDKLTLPLSYHHILQGFIYNILSAEPGYATFLHDHGYTDGNRPFKLFVYSLLEGTKKVSPPNITFTENITFELRSPMDDFCDIFYLALMHRERFHLGGQEIFLTGCVSTKRTVTRDEIKVRTLSPLCMNRTASEDDRKKTIYLSPFDAGFSDAINNNFFRKYAAAYGCAPLGNVDIAPVNVTDRDKYVTKFDDRIYITGWQGIYKLTGDPGALTFLYDCGVGSKNSQGFGMIEFCNSHSI